MKRVLFVFGTRPEAIKLCPVVLHMQQRPEEFDARVCVTAQHREMLDQVLKLFQVQPQVDLNLMKPGQSLFELTANVVRAMEPVLKQERPDWVIVQGDTTTVWTAALSAFYDEILVGHVEAGLRTFDKRQPFPEEINRRICTQLADLHFAPTDRSRQNLLDEKVRPDRIVVTGNTVIDALLWVVDNIENVSSPEVRRIRRWCEETFGDDKMVLVTGHRRESFGEGFENICGAIASLADRYADVHWVYPVHLNPRVQEPVRRILSGRVNVHLIDPLPYAPFAWLMKRATLILTDSGGIQEEAPSLGKRVLVMRNTTERPEGVDVGCVKLVGNTRDGIVSGVVDLLDNPQSLVQEIANPYGDGQASARIADAILAYKD